MKFVRYVFLFLLLYGCQLIKAQVKTVPGFNDEVSAVLSTDSTSKFYVTDIIITGNKKTKNYIILREIPIKKGDSILASQLYALLQNARNLVYNTTLFSEVDIQPILQSGRALTLKIVVIERWYIIPLPQLRIPDSEFVQFPNIDWDLALYGAKFTHYNFSGRGDQLRIVLLNGYARVVSAGYRAPYTNRNLTEGFSLGAAFIQNREFGYKSTFNNAQRLFRRQGFSRNSFSANATYQLRRGYYWRHVFGLQLNFMNVDDSIVTAKYNPNYFNNNRSSSFFPDISYAFQYVNVNNVNYPLKGKVFSFQASKRGIGFKGGMNALTIEGSARKYIDHSKNFYSAFEFFGKLKAPFRLSYLNQQALGYDRYSLRGLERFVIDGYASLLTRYTFSKKLISFNIPVPFNIKILPRIPIAIYAKAYADGGFSLNKKEFNTRLNNKLLYTGGFGIDILTLYDFNFRFEWSFNQLAENRLFLQTRGGF